MTRTSLGREPVSGDICNRRGETPGVDEPELTNLSAGLEAECCDTINVI